MADTVKPAVERRRGPTSTPSRPASGSRPSTRSSQHDGPDRARELLTRVDRARAARRHRADREPQHALCEHDPGRQRAAASRRPGDRAAAALDRPLERDGDGRAGQQGLLRARRAHRQLPVARRSSTRSASTTSGARRPRSTAATSSTSRATPRRATTRAPTWKAGSARTQLDGFRQEARGRAACAPIRTRG